MTTPVYMQSLKTLFLITRHLIWIQSWFAKCNERAMGQQIILLQSYTSDRFVNKDREKIKFTLVIQINAQNFD